jgi:hypothetical protein
LKFTKTAHEYHLQVPWRLQALLSVIYQDFYKATPPNGPKIILHKK